MSPRTPWNRGDISNRSNNHAIPKHTSEIRIRAPISAGGSSKKKPGEILYAAEYVNNGAEIRVCKLCDGVFTPNAANGLCPDHFACSRNIRELDFKAGRSKRRVLIDLDHSIECQAVSSTLSFLMY